jgi:hypothetical protein
MHVARRKQDSRLIREMWHQEPCQKVMGKMIHGEDGLKTIFGVAWY